jgi:hypothetical protein
MNNISQEYYAGNNDLTFFNQPSSHKPFHISAVLFGGAALFALAFAGVFNKSAIGFLYQIFFGGKVYIKVYGFGILHPLMQQSGYFNNPLAGFGFNFEAVANANGFAAFNIKAVAFYFACGNGIGRLCARFKNAYGP